MPQVWLSELMHFVYFLYYLLIALPPLALAVRGRTGALQDAALRMMATYLACYLAYIAFPVDGPAQFVPLHRGPHTDGFWYQLVYGAVERGDSRGTAFPSSHVAGIVTIATVGWLHFPRSVAGLLAAEAAGVVLATVYTQRHYAIDTLAGAALGLAMQALVVPLLLGRLPGLARRAARTAPGRALPVTP
jgi:membrane-associated phospholipid phosphatase